MELDFNVDEVCRTCLNKASPLYSIFDEKCLELNSVTYAVDFLQNFCKITASNIIKLPSKVCSTCADEIKRSYAFKIQCERSAETLSRYIENLIKKDKNIILKKKGNAMEPPPLVLSRARKHDSDDEEMRKTKTRKKVTEKRPVDSTESDVVLIDDDGPTHQSVTKESISKKPPKVPLDPCPLIISKVTSAATPPQSITKKPSKISSDPCPMIISQIAYESPLRSTSKTPSTVKSTPCPLVISQITSGNEVVFDDKTSAKSSGLTSIHDIDMLAGDDEIFLVEIANEEEDGQAVNAPERPDPTSNKENELNSAQVSRKSSETKLKDSADDVIEIDDDDPVQNELFLCHICSAVFQGEDEFLQHVLGHNDSNTTLDESSTSIITPSTSKNDNSARVDSFLCHTCRKMISGSDKFVEHVRACQNNLPETQPALPQPSEEHTEAGRSVPIIDRFMCRKCQKIITGTYTFVEHLKKCSDNDSDGMDPVMCGDLAPFLNRFLCVGCNKMHLGIENFETHVQNCKQLCQREVQIKATRLADGFECGECKLNCADKDLLVKHVREIHVPRRDKFICGVCNHGFPLAEFVTHIKGRFCGQFKCKQCVASLFSTETCPLHKSISSWCKR